MRLDNPLVKLLSLVAASLMLVSTAYGENTTSPYQVVCEQGSPGMKKCKVDKKTYIGWRTYHSACHACHAQDAVGSTFAPSLLDKMGNIGKERFLASVANGYTGAVGVMPAFKDNPNVKLRYEELYAYLMARADGVLPPGRPARLDR